MRCVKCNKKVTIDTSFSYHGANCHCKECYFEKWGNNISGYNAFQAVSQKIYNRVKKRRKENELPN